MNTASCCSEAEKVLIDKSNEDEHCYGYIILDTHAGVVKKTAVLLNWNTAGIIVRYSLDVILGKRRTIGQSL